MSSTTATALLLLMASITQIDAQAVETPSSTAEVQEPSRTPSSLTSLPGRKALCLPVNSIRTSQPEPGEPTCLGSIPCEIPQIPPL